MHNARRTRLRLLAAAAVCAAAAVPAAVVGLAAAAAARPPDEAAGRPRWVLAGGAADATPLAPLFERPAVVVRGTPLPWASVLSAAAGAAGLAGFGLLVAASAGGGGRDRAASPAGASTPAPRGPMTSDGGRAHRCPP